MHVNYRRKIKYRFHGHRWYTALASWKKLYWQKERARERHLMVHERYDDCQVKHPRNILYDAL